MAFLRGPAVAFTGGFTSNPISQTSPNPGAAPPLGQMGYDGAGNVYVLCDAVGTVYGSQPVQINDDWTCQAVGTTGRGRVGVACTNATSDQYLWVQIYGRCLIQLGCSGSSPSDAANGPTTLSNSLATVFCLATSLSSPAGIGYVSGAAAAATSTLLFVIQGMNVASDTTVGDVSAVTSATSHTGNQIGVFLNYPVIVPTDITT